MNLVQCTGLAWISEKYVPEASVKRSSESKGQDHDIFFSAYGVM